MSLMWAALILGASSLATLMMIGGIAGVGYLTLLVIVVLVGAPLGWALFGRHHPAGWLAGLILGYATTSLAWWLVVALGLASTLAFVLASGVAAVAAWRLTKSWSALVPLPPWSRRATTALLLVLLLVPALVAPAFARLGATDASGSRQYRAYFIADFLWHTALTAELAKHEPRPRNPFLASAPAHYYWTYFRVPATVAAQANLDVETVLKVNALVTAFLLLSAMYLAAWVALPEWPFAVAAAVALTIVAPSAEGFAAIADTVRRG